MKDRVIYACMVLAVIGFSGCSKGPSNDTYGNWIRRSDFDGDARVNAASFVINNKAYLGTGDDGQHDYLNDFWEYDPDINAWIQKADFPGVARSGAVGFAAAGSGYITTGYDGLNYLNDCWKYDPVANAWTKVSDFAGTPRYAAAGFSVADKGYLTCGYDGRYLKDFWEYDPSSNQWTSKVSSGGSKRMYPSVFVINNIAYLFGGSDNNAMVSDFWAYDASKDSWTQKRDITNTADSSFADDYTTIERDRAASFVIGDTAYVATGENPSLINNVWQYDPKTDLWVARTVLPSEMSVRLGAVGFSVENRGFIATGGDGGTLVYDDLWEFQPYVLSTQ